MFFWLPVVLCQSNFTSSVIPPAPTSSLITSSSVIQPPTTSVISTTSFVFSTTDQPFVPPAPTEQTQNVAPVPTTQATQQATQAPGPSFTSPIVRPTTFSTRSIVTTSQASSSFTPITSVPRSTSSPPNSSSDIKLILIIAGSLFGCMAVIFGALALYKYNKRTNDLLKQPLSDPTIVVSNNKVALPLETPYVDYTTTEPLRRKGSFSSSISNYNPNTNQMQSEGYYPYDSYNDVTARYPYSQPYLHTEPTYTDYQADQNGQNGEPSNTIDQQSFDYYNPYPYPPTDSPK